MATRDDPTDDDAEAAPSSALGPLQAPPTTPAGRQWGEDYLRKHPEGVDTTGEASIFQNFETSAAEAKQALQQAREKLAAQRMDPNVLGLRVAQAMLAPSRYGTGMSDQLSNAMGAVADWRQQNQQFQANQASQDEDYAQRMTGLDANAMNARLALQKLKEQNQARMLDAAMRATAQPEKPAVPTPTPHYSLAEHDVTMPDGTPGKQTFLLNTATGEAKPFQGPVTSAKGAGLDARSGVMFQRVLSAGNEAATAIKNIAGLPTGASTGWFGVGASPGESLFGAAKGVLTNKMASQEVQDYMSMLPGLSRNLATIETAGLAPAGSLTGSMDKLDLKEGDTGYTKLRKLAEYRQIVEKGLETNLSNPKIPPEQKEAIRKIIDDTRQAVPYTQEDVTGLEHAHDKHPGMTMSQYMGTQGLKHSGVSIPSPSDIDAELARRGLK